jgi:hypothetical protein
MSGIWWGTLKKRRHSIGASASSFPPLRSPFCPPAQASPHPSSPSAMRISSLRPISWNSPRSSPDIADKPPAGAEMVLLHVPDAAVPRTRQELGSAATRLANALSRFEGVHILVFEAADVDAATQMLPASGVVCGAVNRIRGPVRRARGTAEVSIGYAEM